MTAVACDIGGTRIKLGLVQDGQVLVDVVLPAYSDRGLFARLGDIATAIERLCQSADIAISSCQGIAIAFPSLIDVRTGRVLAAYGKYLDAPDLDLRSWANETFGLPLAIENDARMACIGEWQHGAGRGVDDLVMITLGTGLGTATIIQGQVLRGSHGQAGCLGGHTTVRYGGRPCVCGNVGCAEAEASTAALAELAVDQPDYASSSLADAPTLDYAAVSQHAADGDACAQAILRHSIQVWSSLAVNLIHAYDPRTLVIGGGIMASRDSLLPAIAEYVGQHSHTPWGRVTVTASELGDHAALVAAEWLLNEQAC